TATARWRADRAAPAAQPRAGRSRNQHPYLHTVPGPSAAVIAASAQLGCPPGGIGRYLIAGVDNTGLPRGTRNTTPRRRASSERWHRRMPMRQRLTCPMLRAEPLAGVPGLSRTPRAQILDRW